MRALIIGIGSIGRRHVDSIRALSSDTEFIFLRREAKKDEFSDRHGAQVTESLEEALRSKPDLAVIATPSSVHIHSLLPLVSAGLPFYIEKPVVATRPQLEALAAALDRSRFAAPTLAGCNLRYLPSLQKVKEILASGILGRVVRASFQAGQWLPDWRPGRDYRSDYSADASRGGGVILDLVHELDAARWLLGEFDQIHALYGKFSSLDVRTEDTAAILLGKKEGGPVVTVSLDYVSRRRIRRYEFVADRGTLVWDLFDQRLSRIEASAEERIEGGPGAYDTGATYGAAMKEFLSCVRSGRPTGQDVREGMKSAELAIRAKEAG